MIGAVTTDYVQRALREGFPILYGIDHTDAMYSIPGYETHRGLSMYLASTYGLSHTTPDEVAYATLALSKEDICRDRQFTQYVMYCDRHQKLHYNVPERNQQAWDFIDTMFTAGKSYLWTSAGAVYTLAHAKTALAPMLHRIVLHMSNVTERTLVSKVVAIHIMLALVGRTITVHEKYYALETKTLKVVSFVKPCYLSCIDESGTELLLSLNQYVILSADPPLYKDDILHDHQYGNAASHILFDNASVTDSFNSAIFVCRPYRRSVR